MLIWTIGLNLKDQILKQWKWNKKIENKWNKKIFKINFGRNFGRNFWYYCKVFTCRHFRFIYLLSGQSHGVTTQIFLFLNEHPEHLSGHFWYLVIADKTEILFAKISPYLLQIKPLNIDFIRLISHKKDNIIYAQINIANCHHISFW